MLSIEELRTLLAQPEFTDDQIAEIRDILYAFAQTFIDDYVREQKAKLPPPTP